MKTHSTAQYLKWFLFAAVMVGSFFVPMASQKAKAEGVARAGYTNGFNEQFSGNPSNWTIFSGSWLYGGGTVRGIGRTNDFGEIYFKQAAYSNFDYQVRMKRTGCATCSNTLTFRDTGTNAGYFGYSKDGYYYIGAKFGSSYPMWKNWTPSSAIVKGGYNTLRVVATGNTYVFLINNKTVSTMVKSGLSSGVVGVRHYSIVSGGNYLDVDWAVLARK